ncbi:ComEC/Rec2 family competence protein [Armatimonas sp.]|uniref:ComEC/Rec2 family competence protein n=1 Tax=Armatimonas sp. TaxID=1872638 RepID=UPI00286BBFAA|nr:ComEC/Rec2 family competence protein [Armatimonas sp.]
MDRRDQALALAALGILVGCQSAPERLRVTFLDVGQGDSAVIETPSGKVVVIDGGGVPRDPSAPETGADPGTRIVVPFLRSRGISTIDLLIATHPDDDHVQGLLAVTERLTVRTVLDSGLPATPNSPMSQLRAAWKARDITVHTARRGQSFDLGKGVRLEILHPAEPLLSGTRSDDNNNSIVARLVYGKARILFTADAEQEAEESLLKSGLDLSADVLKVGHHGSRGSTSERFLRTVEPKTAILSCGRNNRFGHPHTETLARLKTCHVQPFRTDQQGAILFETDGTQLSFMPLS